MDLNFVGQVFLRMLPALPRTLAITVLPFAAALFLGLLVTLPIVCKIPILEPLCKVYVSFFRGTPFIGQLFMIYFGLPRMFACLSAMDKIEGFALTMVLNSGAYLSEIIRGAFLAVDRGQIEEAKSINLSRMQTLRLIVIPQAIPVAVPSWRTVELMPEATARSARVIPASAPAARGATLRPMPTPATAIGTTNVA